MWAIGRARRRLLRGVLETGRSGEGGAVYSLYKGQLQKYCLLLDWPMPVKLGAILLDWIFVQAHIWASCCFDFVTPESGRLSVLAKC
jgi:hypothetical protein